MKGALFLSGASGRLLPASIPLRFFGAAVVYHLLAWLALGAGAAGWLEFRGGLGWPLAALHLATLGVLGMTAMGAGAQLMPVATRQSAIGAGWLAAIWWLYTPGVALLVLGMGLARPAFLAAGAIPVALALAAWAALMLRHLAAAQGLPGVRAHAWGALMALVALLASALALVAVWLGWPAPDRGTSLGLHLLLAPFGFMGLLAMGLAYVLVPMFALADAPAERSQLGAFALAAAAPLLAAPAVLGFWPGPLRSAALACGLAAVLWHLAMMRRVLAGGLRRELGRSFLLVKLGWAGMVASLLLAAVLWSGLPLPRAQAWFGLALVGVWLLSLVLGMLQRILPFLGSMHAPPAKRRAPTPSSLTHDGLLRIHFICHCSALAGLALALATGWTALAMAAAAAGAVGAAAYGGFYLELLRRMRPLEPGQGGRAPISAS